MNVRGGFLFLFFALMASGAGCIASPGPGSGSVACTEEAKLCPDGSYVGRTGPNCEFAACPSSPTDCSGPGDTCAAGYTCIQKCGPPVVRVDDPPPGYYCERNDIAAQPRMCPICLASNASISTPNGDVNVKDVTVGMLVWSVDADGQRVASAVLAVSQAEAPPTHQVVHLVMSDGREVWVSPNHPTANGLRVGDLLPGDHYDGATVTSADLVPYWDHQTYDLLVDSATGFYWANGVLLGSTLFSDL